MFNLSGLSEFSMFVDHAAACGVSNGCGGAEGVIANKLINMKILRQCLKCTIFVSDICCQDAFIKMRVRI